MVESIEIVVVGTCFVLSEAEEEPLLDDSSFKLSSVSLDSSEPDRAAADGKLSSVDSPEFTSHVTSLSQLQFLTFVNIFFPNC